MALKGRRKKKRDSMIPALTLLYVCLVWMIRKRRMATMEVVSVLARHLRTILFLADIGGWWRDTLTHS